MKHYENGDSVIFKNREYLVVGTTFYENKKYLLLASDTNHFELIVCLLKEKEEGVLLEEIKDQNLKNSMMGKFSFEEEK